MTDESDQPMSPEAEPEKESRTDDTLAGGGWLGGLDLTPDWARGAPGIQSRAPERREREGVARLPVDSARRGLQGVRVKPRREGPPPRGGDRWGEGRGEGRGGRPAREERAPLPPRLPVHVDFIPEKTTLSRVVRIIRQSHRVYELDTVARMFMEKPQSLSVKYTVRENAPGADDFWFYQCKANGMVFASAEACEAYIIERGLGEYYESETREVPPPTGNFVCVGRHRGSGRLIGPPNWHGYQRRLEELRQEIAPGMAPDQFVSQVEMAHEPEAIGAWKQEVSVQTFWRRKVEAEPEVLQEEVSKPEEESGGSEESPEAVEGDSVPAVGEGVAEGAPYDLLREQAESEFRQKVVPELIHKARRAIMPGHLVPHLADEGIASLTRFHLEREHRQPGSIIFALRPAFKHMRLFIFRHEGRMCVSGVQPHALPADQKVIPEIRGILDHVEAHAGCTSTEALQAVHGVTGEPTPEMVSHFRWLIEKGHLLEFADGTLRLPQGRGPAAG